MEQVLHRGLVLGSTAALVCAGLITTTTTGPIDRQVSPTQQIDIQLTTDVFSTVASNINDFFATTTAALTSLSEFHLSAGLANLVGSWLDILFIPENLTTGAIAALTGDTSPMLFDCTPGCLLIDTNLLQVLWNDLMVIPTIAFNVAENLLSFHLADAYSIAAEGFNSVLTSAPGFLVDALAAVGL